ncbi:MAG: WYL domain-containing protein [Myxococcaceae bacterium]
MTTTLAADRLKRLLFLVPYVSRHQGKTLDEVAEAVGCSRAQLLEELDLVTLIGRPPFQPDDFVDLYVEDERVYVDFDQRLSAPPQLTAAEGVALATAAAVLKPTGVLADALGRLEKVLPPQALERYRELKGRLDVGGASGTDALARLTAAVVEHREIEFDYLGVARGETEHRRVRPLELKNHRGEWYLRGFCLTRNDERLFRVDRIAGLNVTSTSFTGAAPAAGARDVEKPVKVRFSPAIAPWQHERFGEAGTLEADGSLVVTVPGDSEAWLARWVLSFGGEARVIEPEWATRVVADAARASLQSA